MLLILNSYEIAGVVKFALVGGFCQSSRGFSLSVIFAVELYVSTPRASSVVKFQMLT